MPACLLPLPHLLALTLARCLPRPGRGGEGEGEGEGEVEGEGESKRGLGSGSSSRFLGHGLGVGMRSARDIVLAGKITDGITACLEARLPAVCAALSSLGSPPFWSSGRLHGMLFYNIRNL